LVSTRDPTVLCCPDHHVLMAFILGPQRTSNNDVPFSLDLVVSLLNDLLPGFAKAIRHVDWLSPRNIEDVWGMFTGNVDHGNMRPGNRMLQRDHRASWITGNINNAYLCGSGRFPGGLVSGRPAERCLALLEGQF